MGKLQCLLLVLKRSYVLLYNLLDCSFKWNVRNFVLSETFETIAPSFDLSFKHHESKGKIFFELLNALNWCFLVLFSCAFLTWTHLSLYSLLFFSGIKDVTKEILAPWNETTFQKSWATMRRVAVTLLMSLNFLSHH